jgi:ABC-type proline/glycine betaine transport system permease subunit
MWQIGYIYCFAGGHCRGRSKLGANCHRRRRQSGRTQSDRQNSEYHWPHGDSIRIHHRVFSRLGIVCPKRRGDAFFAAGTKHISITNPTPKVAFLPIFMIWFGLGDPSKIISVILLVFYPMVIAAIGGTQSVDKQLVWSARSLGASEKEVLWQVILPAALPQIITGLQIAVPLALIVSIVAEFLMGGEGIGGKLLVAQRFADSPGVFAGIVEIAVSGAIVIKTLEYFRRRLLAWHPETSLTTA